MATLKNSETQQRILLRVQHILGRHSGSSQTTLLNPEASRLHATIYWNGVHWLIKDTSSNGTFINNKSIPTGSKYRLNIGDNLKFGTLNASTWVFEDDQPPKSLLIGLDDGKQTIELEGVVVLPDETSPEVTLYQVESGQWVSENQFGLTHLENGQMISANNNKWVFIDAEAVEKTLQSSNCQNIDSLNIKLNFTVSKNEEHVSMTVLLDQLEIDLGERTHHYLMLFLARKRLKDYKQGVESSEQGWIDKGLLCQQTGLDEKYINLQIYRFRKQLIQANPAALQLLQIVERRRGELRFASTSVEVEGGNDLMKLS